MSSLKRKSHASFNLRYHIILATKYRLKILDKLDIIEALKYSQANFEILYYGLEKDHIHMIIESYPNISVSYIIARLKQFSTYYIWKNQQAILKKYYWKRRNLWSNAYFAATIGDISGKQVQQYLEKQSRSGCIYLPKGTK